jgi:hypothetical protein
MTYRWGNFFEFYVGALYRAGIVFNSKVKHLQQIKLVVRIGCADLYFVHVCFFLFKTITA